MIFFPAITCYKNFWNEKNNVNSAVSYRICVIIQVALCLIAGSYAMSFRHLNLNEQKIFKQLLKKIK